jgi:hypothetical protein
MRYAVETWNASPIGAGGFPVKKSFKKWDAFTAKPGGVPDEKISLGGAKTKTFELSTSTQGPLSTWFNRAAVDDRKVRQLQFKNADFGKPGSAVQAFIKLANGKWLLEDWSAEQTVSFCRDRANENVVQLVIASSNAAAAGAPLGVVKHKLVAKDKCGLPRRFDGTWRTVDTNTSRGSWRVEYTGRATFVAKPGITTDTHAEYGITDSQVSWTASGTQDLGDGCSYTFSGGGNDSPPDKHPTMMSLDDVTNRSEAPKPEPKPFFYSIWVHGDEAERHEYDVTARCNGETETFKDSVSTFYLHVGFRDFFAGIPPEIMKSADPMTLEGRRTRTSSSNSTSEETWKFEGSD